MSKTRDIERAQREIFDSGFDNPDSNRLLTVLRRVTNILGLAFIANTPGAVVTGVTGLVSNLVPNAQEILKSLVYEGYWQLGYLEDFLVDNPEYDLLDVEFPFIEYDYTTDGKKVRFITGEGVVKRVHSGNGWIVL